MKRIFSKHEIYSFRNEVLHSEDILALAEEMIEHTIQLVVEEHFISRAEEGKWNPEAYRQWLLTHFPVSFEEHCFDDDHLHIEEIEKITIENLRIDDSNHSENYRGPAIFSNINPEMKDDTYVEKYPYVITKKVILKNVTTESGKELRISDNEYMFRNVEIRNN